MTKTVAPCRSPTASRPRVSHPRGSRSHLPLARRGKPGKRKNSTTLRQKAEHEKSKPRHRGTRRMHTRNGRTGSSGPGPPSPPPSLSSRRGRGMGKGQGRAGRHRGGGMRRGGERRASTARAHLHARPGRRLGMSRPLAPVCSAWPLPADGAPSGCPGRAPSRPRPGARRGHRLHRPSPDADGGGGEGRPRPMDGLFADGGKCRAASLAWRSEGGLAEPSPPCWAEREVGGEQGRVDPSSPAQQSNMREWGRGKRSRIGKRPLLSAGFPPGPRERGRAPLDSFFGPARNPPPPPPPAT